MTGTDTAIHAVASAAPSGTEQAATLRSRIPAAMADGARAYVKGLSDLARSLGGFVAEIGKESRAHVEQSLKARNLRSFGELQLAWAQHRVETSATHVKEFADLARDRSEAVIEPFTALLVGGMAV